MTDRLLRAGKYIAFFIAGVVLLYLAFRGADIQKIVTIVRNANYWWILLSMLMGYIAFVVRGARWLILIDSLGYRAGMGNSINAVIIGYLANLALPRVGELTRCTALSRVERIPVEKLFGTILVERAIDMIMLFLLVCMTVLVNMDIFGGFFLDTFTQKAAQSQALIWYIGGAFLLLAVVAMVAYRYRARLAHLSLVIKIRALFQGVREGFITVFNMEKKGAFVFQTLSIWGLYYLMTYVVFFSVDYTADFGPDKGLFIMLSGALGMVAPTQGGIGAYHWMVREALVVLGIEPDAGLTFATMLHGAQVLTILITGAVATAVLFYFTRRKPMAETNQKEKNKGPDSGTFPLPPS